MRYFLGFLISIGLIVLVIFLLFRGPSKPKVPATSKTLDSYASTNAELSLTVDGPINAQSEHEASRITVSRNNVTFEHIKGYEGQVVDQRTYDNNTEAFENFLKALEKAEFTQGNNEKTLADERGYCATGSRYIFEMKQGEKQLERYWATSCGKPKTYEGNVGRTIALFRAQVPDYQTITNTFDLSF